jgi:hypothetical protein
MVIIDLKKVFGAGVLLLIYIGVIALGLLAVNQYLGYHYKAIFLKTPCDLCEELNPHLKECFYTESTYTENLTDPFIDKLNNLTIP